MSAKRVFESKRILITGGTGSLGKSLCRRILSGEFGTPKKIIVFSRDEAKQHYMRMSYLNRKVATDETIYNNFLNVLEFRIGDVRNYADVRSAVRDSDVVINAAALKQVPTCEYFPEQAILTNCMGASNLVRAISEEKAKVETVVGISTDKACKPINAMGISKALQESIFKAANILNRETRFVAVRYGNVLASRGSVIPLFHDQIRHGGPVTVTEISMTRFLLSLDQAVDTIIAAVAEAKAGEIYVPNAPAARMIDVAKALIEDRPIKVEVTGIRPGEKYHEIMVGEEEALRSVKRGSFYAIKPMLPELIQRNGYAEESPALKKEMSSGDKPLSMEKTRELLLKHQLMVTDKHLSEGEELLR